MALNATVYSFEINLSDLDRNVYQALAFRVAQHPSETDAYLMTRVLAYCLEYREGLSFSKGGLSDPDAPALAVHDLTGALLRWFEIGLPEYVSFRLANAYGPRNISGPLPTFFQRLTARKPCFVMDTRRDFIYDAEHDHYTCPAGAKLTKARRRADHTEDLDFYRHLSACFTCPLRPRCTPTKLRRIKRWVNEDVLDRMQARLDRMPEAMGVRRQTVEHPFGTLKAWMGATHFLTRTLDKVRTEMSLHVLAYNFKRMIAILGVAPLIQAMRV